MSKDVYKLMTLIGFLLVLIVGLKILNDYYIPPPKPDFKSIKKQYFIGKKTEDDLSKVKFQKVVDVTDEQLKQAEIAVLNLSGPIENAPSETIKAMNHQGSSSSVTEYKAPKIIEIPDKIIAQRMLEALKQEGQKVLLYFEKENKESQNKNPNNKNATVQTSCSVDENESPTSTPIKNKVFNSEDFRTVTYEKNENKSADDFFIEKLSFKLPLAGSAFAGTYDKKYSTSSDFDIPIQAENHYIIQAVFEGVDGGRISGEMIKVDPNTGAPFKSSQKITIYGKICASGKGYLITTENGKASNTFSLSYPSF